MKYISKGIVVNGSTEQILHVTRCGVDFQLTGEQAALWLNGRFAFAQCKMENPRLRVALEQLRRQELVELAKADEAGEYRALTQCVLIPAKVSGFRAPLRTQEKWVLQWLCEAGMHLTMAELVFLKEHGMEPESQWLGEENRQKLTEAIYTGETIFDNILEAKMEHAGCRDMVVRDVLSLLKKKRILLL